MYFHYKKGAPGNGLVYGKHGLVKVKPYLNADYAGDRYKISHHNFCIYVGRNLSTLKNKKQVCSQLS